MGAAGRTCVPWTKSEDDLLREHVPEHGTRWAGWAELLPNRTVGAIDNRASVIGVRRTARDGAWSEHEIAMLCEHYPEHGDAWVGWAEVLPRRTRVAIASKASRLGVKGKSRRGKARALWTPEEDEVIRAVWPLHPSAGWDGWSMLLPQRGSKSIDARHRMLAKADGGAADARVETDRAIVCEWTTAQTRELINRLADTCAAVQHSPSAVVDKLMELRNRAARLRTEGD